MYGVPVFDSCMAVIVPNHLPADQKKSVRRHINYKIICYIGMSRRYAVGIQFVQWTDAITGPFGSFGFYSQVRNLNRTTPGVEYLVKAYNFNRYPAMCKLAVGTP